MPNEKVSQMTVLDAVSIASDDIFLVGDVSAHESKQMTADQLLLFIESSGSFNAINATNSDSASYILGSDVDGIVDSSSYASSVVSASYALRTALADTASYFSASVGTSFTTASFLLYTAPHSNGTASYALNAATSVTSITSVNLSYTGVPNGTSSFAMSASNAYSASQAGSSSFAKSSSFSDTASFTITSSFSNYSTTCNTASYALNFNSPVKAWAMVTWSFGALYTQPSLYMQNNIESVRFVGTWNYSGTTHYTWMNYGITFVNDLPSTNYILQGQCFCPYMAPEKADVIFHPVYSKRTISTCTMSIAIDLDSVTVANFFAGTSGSFPTTDQTYVTFGILG